MLNDVYAVIAKLEVEDLAVLSSKVQGKDKSEVRDVFRDEAASLRDAGKVKEGDLKWLS